MRRLPSTSSLIHRFVVPRLLQLFDGCVIKVKTKMPGPEKFNSERFSPARIGRPADHYNLSSDAECTQCRAEMGVTCLGIQVGKGIWGHCIGLAVIPRDDV